MGPISLTDISLFGGLNLIHSDSWLSLSLFVKLAPALQYYSTVQYSKDYSTWQWYHCSLIVVIFFLMQTGIMWKVVFNKNQVCQGTHYFIWLVLQHLKTWGNKIINSIFSKPLPQKIIHTKYKQISSMICLFHHNQYANAGWQKLKL